MAGSRTPPTSDDAFDWGDEVSTFGDRLARAREHAGLDQAELSRRLGVRLATIRNWESDRAEPRANRMQMLSGLLNVSIIWLMTGEGPGVPDTNDRGTMEAEMRDVLGELQRLRTAQTRLADRIGKVENRLRALIDAG